MLLADAVRCDERYHCLKNGPFDALCIRWFRRPPTLYLGRLICKQRQGLGLSGVDEGVLSIQPSRVVFLIVVLVCRDNIHPHRYSLAGFGHGAKTAH